MTTMIRIVVLIGLFAAPASATQPQPDDCRNFAAKSQKVADGFNDMIDLVESLTSPYEPTRTLNIAISDGAIERERVAKAAVIEALQRYRDSVDVLAAEIRSCQPIQ
ncbi:hypothetical protein [Thalassobaculum litoreum]|uniref:hypothetical protein n=1 Tax=Thalassobaculum litoreum TaxID=420996 RepID=UPI000B83AB70|nr:hypothetical protein [Thalassobaculum litoreum]